VIRNYFYIFRGVKELRKKLSGKKITDIYSQEKDVLFFQFEPEKNGDFPALAVSANFQMPYMALKKNQRKAKKNFIEFCTDELPLTINDISIAATDRVVKIVTDKLTFFYAIRGPRTNVVFLKSDGLAESFKKTKEENGASALANEFSALEFIDDEEKYFERFLEKYSRLTIDEEVERRVRSEFPQFNKEIFLQFRTRNEMNAEKLVEIVREILNDAVAVSLTSEKRVALYPASWKEATAQIEEKFVFNEYLPALSKYLALKFKYDSFSRLYSEIEKKLLRDLDYYANRMNNLKLRIEKGSQAAEYKKIADLLLANLFKLQKGMSEIELVDFVSGEPIKIALDEKLSPNKNVDRYYEKAHDEKINFERSVQLLARTEKKYFELLEIKENLPTIADVKSLLELKKKLKLDEARKKGNDETSIKYRKFLIDGKYEVFVGKDSKSNDALTMKFAKQNDLWFHARGVSGSHVILRITNSKEAVPKPVLKKVASLAAFFSKAKTAKLAPVAFTFRKFVHKKKGMPSGQVVIQRENVLIVAPEIPKNTEEIYD
jgi:predicted ribosome quality control (RQC) complex YloA/Tae2 family protein